MSSIERLKEYKAQAGPHGESTKANIKYWQERASANSDAYKHRAAGNPATNGKRERNLDPPKLPSTGKRPELRDTESRPLARHSIDARMVALQNANHDGASTFMRGVRRSGK
jgi:hypothetical protein